MIWTVIFGVALLVTAYYIFALLFHWIKYSAALPLVWISIPIYLGGVGFLTLISLAAYINLL